MARLLHSEEFEGMDEHGIIWAKVAMECLLTTELYPVYTSITHILLVPLRIFGRHNGDAQRDDYFYTKLAQHTQWITKEHLDLKCLPDLTKASQGTFPVLFKHSRTGKDWHEKDPHR
jgi:hypothetical protein